MPPRLTSSLVYESLDIVCKKCRLGTECLLWWEGGLGFVCAIAYLLRDHNCAAHLYTYPYLRQMMETTSR